MSEKSAVQSTTLAILVLPSYIGAGDEVQSTTQTTIKSLYYKKI